MLPLSPQLMFAAGRSLLAAGQGQSTSARDTIGTQMGGAKVVTREVETAGGGRLYVEEAGRGSSVVLLHAGLLDRPMWDYEFQRLIASRRAIRYDMRGHGESTDVPWPSPRSRM